MVSFILALVFLNLLVFAFCLLVIGIISFTSYLIKLSKDDLPDSNKYVNVVRYFVAGSVGKGISLKRVYIQSFYITVFINVLLIFKAVVARFG